MSGHLLEVRDLRIQYPTAKGGRSTVVDGVSWHIDRNEVLGIVGESGSGKSQTAFAVLGLWPENALVSNGQIWIDCVQTVDHTRMTIDQGALGRLRGKRISYIPQEPMSNLDPSFTIGSPLPAGPDHRRRAHHRAGRDGPGRGPRRRPRPAT